MKNLKEDKNFLRDCSKITSIKGLKICDVIFARRNYGENIKLDVNYFLA